MSITDQTAIHFKKPSYVFPELFTILVTVKLNSFSKTA